MIGMEENEKDFENLSREQIHEECYWICSRIYIARNITLNNDTILKELEKIDRLLSSKENYN